MFDEKTVIYQIIFEKNMYLSGEKQHILFFFANKMH